MVQSSPRKEKEMRYFLTVQEDPETGDLFFVFPDELIDEMGWNVGDELTWKETEKGWTLGKEEN